MLRLDCCAIGDQSFMTAIVGTFFISDWEFGVRVVEVFAAAMMLLAVFHLTVENYMNRFGFRSFAERLAAGTLCLLGGEISYACLHWGVNFLMPICIVV